MKPLERHDAGRILFVSHTSVLGGAELSLLDIIVAFRERSATALFEDGPLAAELVARGIAVIPVGFGSALRSVKKQTRVPSPSAFVAMIRSARALARAARAFDVLYSNSPKSFLVSALAGILARRPVIWHVRDILDTAHFSHSNLRLLVRTANARAALVVANSQATADAFIAAGGTPGKVRVVYCGVEGSAFEAVEPAARAAARAALGIPNDAFLLGSFSRVSPWKGQQVLLDALEQLPDVRAIIVGGALFSGEEEFQQTLVERASQPALKGRVQFLGVRRDIPVLLAMCDVVVHTAVLPEPFGRVLVEALLARRPLIASDAGGAREVVRDGETGLRVPPGDPVRLAGAIRTLRDNPALAERLASAGASDVRERFTLERTVDGVSAALDHVLRRTTE